ncbi:unnamed protein product [Schistosoma curassoni]|uniref:Uncharacterized protein n=1 Tax=Schistosoma curassoni TaxID=6186 RepID=A0A183JHK2_9TREM|nr:unnamed protein product [Schistosoma curassoni]
MLLELYVHHSLYERVKHVSVVQDQSFGIHVFR